MCGRFVLRSPTVEIIHHFGVEEFSDTRIAPHFNVAPTQLVPAVRLGETNRRELVPLRWGLVPHWAKEPGTGYSTINARAETVATRPAFREPFRRRRCLIPSDGFYEWQPAKPRNRPWHVRLRGGGLFAFAGLWDRWRSGAGQQVESCSVIVTDANDLLRPIHERMPVILDPPDYETWLDVRRFDRATLEALLKPFPPERLEAYPVSARVNQAAYDDEACIAPLAGPRR